MDSVGLTGRDAGRVRGLVPGQSIRGTALCCGASLLAAGLVVECHHRWERAPGASPRRALLDGVCHLGTALVVAWPALPSIRERRRFMQIIACSALLLDLDHIPAARSARLERCMTMPGRPVSHSVVSIIALAAAVEVLVPGRQLSLATLLGLSSHLLRDLATGGAPLLHPKRVVTVSTGAQVLLLSALTLAGRSASRRFSRHATPVPL
jgi:hypothetical protein